jgi:hypothetical protein
MSDHRQRVYGLTQSGQPIVVPEGWQLLPEGAYVPHGHREYISQFEGFEGWARPRRAVSTMTPIHARVWGDVRAIAVPLAPAGVSA